MSANGIVRKLLEDPGHDWNEIFALEIPSLPVHLPKASRRKLMAHMLFHSQRHSGTTGHVGALCWIPWSCPNLKSTCSNSSCGKQLAANER